MALAIVMVLGLATGVRADEPVTLPEREVRFPRAVVTEKLTLSLPLTNDSDVPMTVTKILPSCGCMATPDGEYVVRPGQTLPIPLFINPQNFAGQFDKHVIVQTDSESVPLIRFRVRGEFYAIERSLTAQPAAAMFGAIPPGQRSTRVVMISRVGFSEVGPLEFEHDSWFEAVWQERSDRRRNMAHLEIRATAPNKTGTLKGEIRLRGTGEDDRLTIPVSMTVLPAYFVEPEFVRVGDVGSGIRFRVSSPTRLAMHRDHAVPRPTGNPGFSLLSESSPLVLDRR